MSFDGQDSSASWAHATGNGSGASEGRGLWTPEEHDLFVHGIKLFPSGPWKDIATHVGSRTARQTMTHAQKYRQKIARRLRNVRMSGRYNLPHSLDRSSRFNALLSNDEQFNDSILATALAIAAEKELDMLDDGNNSPVGDVPPEMYQSLPEAIAYSNGDNNAYFLTDSDASMDTDDLEFEKCMDFLIATFHRET
ncbi:Myb-like dna-binding, partial [Globisporangium splendens]